MNSSDTRHLPKPARRRSTHPLPPLSEAAAHSDQFHSWAAEKFPLVVPAAPPVPSSVAGEGNPVSGDHQPPVVVIATEDPQWSAVAVQALRWQCRLRVVCSGEEAFDLIEAGGTDAVLMDERLPEYAAMRLCERIAARPRLKHVAVFVLGGAFNPEAQAQAEMLGAAGYLAHPCSAGRLRALVLHAIGC